MGHMPMSFLFGSWELLQDIWILKQPKQHSKVLVNFQLPQRFTFLWMTLQCFAEETQENEWLKWVWQCCSKLSSKIVCLKFLIWLMLSDVCGATCFFCQVEVTIPMDWAKRKWLACLKHLLLLLKIVRWTSCASVDELWNINTVSQPHTAVTVLCRICVHSWSARRTVSYSLLTGFRKPSTKTDIRLKEDWNI